jgi:signal transduction histidine kinase
MNKKDKYCNPVEQNKQLEKENQQLKINNNNFRHEIKLLNEKLNRSESLVQFSENASEIAHEINNPVNLVSGSMSILNNNVQNIIHLMVLYRQLPDLKKQSVYKEIRAYEDEINVELTTTELSKCLIRIKKAIGRIHEVTNNLSLFGKSKETIKLKVDINENIKNTLTMVETAFNDNLQLHTEFGNIPTIKSYMGKLNQVFTNLTENALEAIREKPEVKNEFLFIKTSLKNNKIIIEFKDSGIGMSAKTKKRLFEKFYTTKSPDKGTGLGMTISKRIIENHKGTIEVESERGKGTTFTISLPVKH